MTIFKRVAVALSGGVDSAVSALLLKNKGYEVIGTFMKNWKSEDVDNCGIEESPDDAKWICNRLNIPFTEISFAKTFWDCVALDLIAAYNVGLTPNADIPHNKCIKFGCYFKHCIEKLDVDAIATGHYAQSSYGTYLENYNPSQPAQLLKGANNSDEQSFFLSQITQSALQRSMFPVGLLNKLEVKKIAQNNSLDQILTKTEIMDSCFKNPKNLQSFISRYIPDEPGIFVEIDTGDVVGEHSGIHWWTIGQQCLDGYFVAAKNTKNIIYVVSKRDHPALFCRSLILKNDSWIISKPEKLIKGRFYSCKFKLSPEGPLVDCKLIDMVEEDIMLLDVDQPLHAAVPGQYAVFYEGDVCLGSAQISYTGPSDVFLNSNTVSEADEAPFDIIVKLLLIG